MKRVSNFKLGLFLLICGGLGLAALLGLGATQLFQHGTRYVAFFNEPVDGLQPGAAVNYLGVAVGNVRSVGLAPDGRLVRVVFQVRSDFKSDGMAASLGQAGLTGPHYLALRPAPPDIQATTPRIGFPTHYPVIPTQPGRIASLEDALQRTSRQLASVDLEGLVGEWKKAAQAASGVLTGQDLRRALRDSRAVADRLQTLVAQASPPGTPEQLRRGLEDATAAAAATRRASEALAAQLDGVPVHAVADVTQQVEALAQTGQRTVGDWSREVAQSLTLLRGSVDQMNELLRELRGLTRSLQANPGRILERSAGGEPFVR
jgi:ABC-type transporter Mla subunit MlaD